MAASVSVLVRDEERRVEGPSVLLGHELLVVAVLR